MVQAPGATGFNMLADYRHPMPSVEPLQEGTYLIQVDVRIRPLDNRQRHDPLSVHQSHHRRQAGSFGEFTSSGSHLQRAALSRRNYSSFLSANYWRYYFHSNILPCQPGRSENFFIGGMRAETSYTLCTEIVNNGNVTWGAALTFKTGTISATFRRNYRGSIRSRHQPNGRHPAAVLHRGNAGTGSEAAYPPTAYNLNGDVTWYYPTTPPMGST